MSTIPKLKLVEPQLPGIYQNWADFSNPYSKHRVLSLQSLVSIATGWNYTDLGKSLGNLPFAKKTSGVFPYMDKLLTFSDFFSLAKLNWELNLSK